MDLRGRGPPQYPQTQAAREHGDDPLRGLSRDGKHPLDGQDSREPTAHHARRRDPCDPSRRRCRDSGSQSGTAAMKVGVVGLGIAGLRAATLLEKYGAEVELFEARGRPGGRLHTIDEGGGAVYEAGGEWIDADHLRCIRLLEEFNVEPMARGSWPGKVVYHGRHSTEAELWNDALEDDLR